ncbi:MAG: hypothetical protein HY852_14430 [Bradyrhizobium sp.]|uniref:hypothetical protein n=1 Tax=Bradyrhizobium sp. TaxID=376 RepID=UPI0025B8F897|nr:hypothetical protein [Bradyrhizobium sp.]MBI5263005.1 hypothetical protein [Bradyrhizobium sp.]
MPLLRYFVFVGGALLALLLVVSAAFPTAPATDTVVSSSDLPSIRIHSEHKLPARVVLDTTQPTISPPLTIAAETVAPLRPGPAEMSAKARVRESFAQFVPSPSKAASAASNRAEIRSQQAPKRKVAKARPGPPIMLVAQQPHFGPFYTWR